MLWSVLKKMDYGEMLTYGDGGGCFKYELLQNVSIHERMTETFVNV